MGMRQFIDVRFAELGITRSELVSRWGYKNITKGLRQLDSLEEGLPDSRSRIRLASALEVPLETLVAQFELVEAAAKIKEESERKAEYDAWALTFKPHAICVPKNARPNQIFVIALMGAERILRINFDLELSESERIEYVNKVLPTVVAGFGEVGGFVINSAIDCAAVYDREGVLIRKLDRAHRPGYARLTIGGREAFSGNGLILND